MRRLGCIALLLCGGAAFADGTAGPGNNRITRSNFLRIPAYETSGTGAVTYFVDGTNGSDTNSCTASGTSACATIQGAVNKIPKLLRDLVTVSIAAGSYKGFYVSGFEFDPGLQQNNGGLFFNGVLANSTLATGSATGTATGGTAGSGSTFGTLTDAAQTWTVNDLVGRFVVITGGTGNGQIFVIDSNTATALTVEGTWTAPNGTSTYAIQDAAAIINTAIVAPPSPATAASGALFAVYVSDNVLNYRTKALTFQNIRTTTTRGFVIADASSVLLNQVQIPNTNNNVNLGSFDGKQPSNFFLQASALNGGGAACITQASYGNVTVSNSLLNNCNNGVTSLGTITLTASDVKAAVNVGLSGTGYSTISVSGSNISCNGVNATAISNVASTPQTSPQAPTQVSSVSTTAIGSGCTFAISMIGPGAVASVSSLTGGPASTAALDARLGGMIQYTAATTVTGTSQDIEVEGGAVTAALGDVTSGQCLTSLSYISRVCKQ